MSKQPLNKNAARKKVSEIPTAEPSKVDIPKIDVAKVETESDMEIMSISESVKEKIPMLGVGFVLFLMAISLIGHYYSMIFG